MPDAVDEVIDRLRATRDPELLRLVDEAEAVAAAPDADVVEPYRWFLARVGEGVELTAAGYLPPALVLDTMQTLGWDADWIGAGNREDLTIPVAELRSSARRLGLVRVHRGTLLRTPLGRRLTEDPTGLWQHLADRLPLGRSELEQQAGVLWLLATAAGRTSREQLVARALGALGWVDRTTRRGPEAHEVAALVRDTWVVFDRLGLVPRRRRRPGDPAPSAGRALARAAVLGSGGVGSEVVGRAASGTAGGAVTEPSGPVPGGAAVELTVTLSDVEPPVWRRIVVPESLTLRQLHAVLQTAMGWEDAHLFLFRIAGVTYGDVDDFPGELGDDETFTVGDAAGVTGTFAYEYDFGDGWEHVVQIGQRLPSVGLGTPHCIAGARACPPEDCGGAPGYEHLLEVLGDPGDPEHAELVEWVGGGFDPEAFDLDSVNELLDLYDRHTRQRLR